MSLEAVYRRSERFVGRRMADQFVVVPLAGRGVDADCFYTMNQVAAALWEALDGKRTGHDLVAALLERYEVDRDSAERDCLDFLESLAGLGALEDVG